MRKKKNNAGLFPALFVFLFSFFVLGEGRAAGMPVDLEGESGHRFSVSVSRDNINTLIVKGDAVTAVTAKTGRLTSKEKTSTGALLFQVSGERPFTFVVETRSGKVFSFHATPVSGPGKTWRLFSLGVEKKTDVSAEKAHPFETLLVSLNKAILGGKIPPGYVVSDDREKNIGTKNRIHIRRLSVWSGGRFRIEQYRLTNTSEEAIYLRETDFFEKGVRSVLFWPGATSLMSGGASQMVIVREQGEVS